MGGNGIEEDCNTGLSLGLGVGNYHERRKDNKPTVRLYLSSTLSNKGSSLKIMEDAEEEEEEYDNVNINGGRKKLRLTKEQSTLLEDTFKFRTNLNPGQKQELAKKLKLKPRQVEVWFQNRRARTKLKQTETDCEFLKKCCARLSDENRRLKRGLQELQSLRPPTPSPFPLHIQVPKVAAKLPFCQPCEQPMVSDRRSAGSSAAAFDSL